MSATTAINQSVPKTQNQGVQNSNQVNSNRNDDANISLCGRIYRAVKSFFTAIGNGFLTVFKGIINFLKNRIFKPIVNFPGKVINLVKRCLGLNKKVEGEDSPKNSSSSNGNSGTNSRVASATTSPSNQSTVKEKAAQFEHQPGKSAK